jgi:hypothetical protein
MGWKFEASLGVSRNLVSIGVDADTAILTSIAGGTTGEEKKGREKKRAKHSVLRVRIRGIDSPAA